MTIPKFSPFDLSSINSSDASGLDGSEKTKFPIYIASNNTEHVIALKPFVQNIKYNLTKELEYMSDKDKWEKVIKEYTGDLTIDLDLKLPASSPSEARNNVAKIEYLQKMLLEPYSEVGVGINVDESFKVGPLFSVSFSNLIFGDKPLKTDSQISTVISDGFTCTIKSVSYQPDVKAGFHEFDKSDEYLYPKVLDLTLSLAYENNNFSDFDQPIKGYTRSGKLISGDMGRFPFDAGVFTYAQVANEIKSKINYNSRNYYIHLFRDGTTALFPAFIEDFSRDFEVENNVLETKSKYIGKGIDTGKFTTPQKLSYKVNFSVPCANIEQSKIFCAEVNKLMRMFYRPQETDAAISRDPFKIYIPGFIEGPSDPQSFADILTPGSSETILDVEEELSIEVSLQPGSLEQTEATDELDGGFSDVSQEETKGPSTIYNAPGIYLFMEDLGIEMMHDMGFFEVNGLLFPKGFKITMNLVSEYSHRYKSSIQPFKFEEDETVTDENELFPFNRQTFKIGE